MDESYPIDKKIFLFGFYFGYTPEMVLRIPLKRSKQLLLSLLEHLRDTDERETRKMIDLFGGGKR